MVAVQRVGDVAWWRWMAKPECRGAPERSEMPWNEVKRVYHRGSRQGGGLTLKIGSLFGHFCPK